MDTKPHELLEYVEKYVTDNENGMRSCKRRDNSAQLCRFKNAQIILKVFALLTVLGLGLVFFVPLDGSFRHECLPWCSGAIFCRGLRLLSLYR